MKVWIASDITPGEYFTIPEETPAGIAHKYGRAERGEIIHIWLDDYAEGLPDIGIYWDDHAQQYKRNF